MERLLYLNTIARKTAEKLIEHKILLANTESCLVYLREDRNKTNALIKIEKDKVQIALLRQYSQSLEEI
jgi:hypothetical protein